MYSVYHRIRREHRLRPMDLRTRNPASRVVNQRDRPCHLVSLDLGEFGPVVQKQRTRN